MQRPLQKALLGFGDVNPAKGSLGQGVCRNEGQTVDTNLVDAINGLEGGQGTEGLCLRPDTPVPSRLREATGLGAALRAF